jgi:hypothetical protein
VTGKSFSGFALLCLLAWACGGMAAEPSSVALAAKGKALVTLYVAGPADRLGVAAAAVDDLQRVLEQMVGAPFARVEGPFAGKDAPGLYVGAADDFLQAGFDVPRDLDGQELLLKTTANGQVLLIGGGPWGISHAIYTLLDELGCRWYFMGDAWEVIPRQADLSAAIDLRKAPDFFLQRKIWAGHGVHSAQLRRDFDHWMRRNRMGTPVGMATSHSWPGIDPTRDFAEHPEWFAQVKGERKASKPCYAHPEVIRRGMQRALDYFRQQPDADMITVSAPDGVNFCECDRCKALAGVEEIHEAFGTPFGKRADGREVSLPSETIFHYANEVARAVAKEFPGKYVGCLAYSCYAHPPSFSLEPNIYVEITRGYRRTPLTQSEQITQFAAKAKMLGIYEYFDVEQWSWDKPGAARAAQLDYLAGLLPYYYRNNMRSLNGEMSLNFAPNGIGYYTITRLLWDHRTDIRAVEAEFYRNAFGPAAGPVQRFYRRWESGQSLDARTLALAYRDLADAAVQSAGQPAYRARVDQLRMYAHFLKCFLQPNQSAERLNEQFGAEEAKRRVQELGDWTARLLDTGMTHSWAFNRYLIKAGDALGCDTKAWMQAGTAPTGEEIAQLFAADLRDGLALDAGEVPVTLFSRNLAPLKTAAPRLVPAVTAPIMLEIGRTNSLYLPTEAGQPVELTFAKDLPQDTVPRARFVSKDDYAQGLAELEYRQIDGEVRGARLVFPGPGTGYLRVEITAAPTAISGPAFLTGALNLKSARLYFFVPKGTPRFLLRTGAHGGPTILLKDAGGLVILDVANATRNEFLVEVPEGADGAVWSVEGPRDINGVAGMQLIGVPNYFSLQPDQLLVPVEVLR